jgi:ribosomal subunit interface protein
VNVLVKARHMEVTDALRQHVEAKVAKLPRCLEALLSVEVTLNMEAEHAVAEIVATARQRNTFVATHRDADMYTCIDQCLHKIAEQVRRHKGRVRDRKQAPPPGADGAAR